MWQTVFHALLDFDDVQVIVLKTWMLAMATFSSVAQHPSASYHFLLDAVFPYKVGLKSAERSPKTPENSRNPIFEATIPLPLQLALFFTRTLAGSISWARPSALFTVFWIASRPKNGFWGKNNLKVWSFTSFPENETVFSVSVFGPCPRLMRLFSSPR